MLNVLHAAFEDAADDIAIARTFDGIFFKYAILEERDPSLELFAVDDNFVAGLAWSHPKHAFHAFGHGNECVGKFAKHWGGCGGENQRRKG